MGSALEHTSRRDRGWDLLVRLRVRTAWSERLCARGAWCVGGQHRGGSVHRNVSPIRPRSSKGQCFGRTCRELVHLLGGVGILAWGLGLGPRSRRPWKTWPAWPRDSFIATVNREKNGSDRVFRVDPGRLGCGRPVGLRTPGGRYVPG